MSFPIIAQRRLITVAALTAVSALIPIAMRSLASAPVSASTRTAQVTVIPDQGPPGTVVTLTGYVPSARPGKKHRLGIITFGGQTHGLFMNASAFTWSKTLPGHFVTHFTVPAVPWLSPQGQVTLKAGSYVVGIQCLGTSMARCRGTDEATTSFDLTHPGRSTHPKLRLTVSPSPTVPGHTVTISGWAPLTAEVRGQPEGYQVILGAFGEADQYGQIGHINQRANGDLSGRITLPVSLPFGPLPDPSQIALQYLFPDLGAVQASSSLILDVHDVSLSKPLTWHQATAGQTVSRLISNQNRGYFRPLTVSDGDLYTAAAGQLWRGHAGQRLVSLPTQSLSAAIQAMGFQWFDQSNVVGLTTIAAYPQRLFASIPAERPQEGAPPIDELGLYSSNAGKTWTAVPRPKGMSFTDFGGFQTQAGAVWAWWQTRHGTISVEASTNGGTSWHLVDPQSAMARQALWLGPVPAQSFGEMSTQTEPIVRGSRRGWITVGSVVINTGQVAQLATLSNGSTVLIGGVGAPVQITSNRGRTWNDVTTAPVPPQEAPNPPALRLLPNGALLTTSGDDYVLNQGSDSWRRVPATEGLPSPSSVAIQGSLVYWILSRSSIRGKAIAPKTLVVPVSRY